jgi:tRNA uridine 5-carboxymethylaminomethyl modification enzyme
VGLISDIRYEKVLKKYDAVDREIKRLESTFLPPTPELASLLESCGTTAPPSGVSLASLLRRPQLDYKSLAPFDRDRPGLSQAVAEQAEISIKYDGYIRRQTRQVEDLKRMETVKLPEDIDYDGLQGLRLEARQKLGKIRPLNLGQASRISGVSPADIAALMIYLGRG